MDELELNTLHRFAKRSPGLILEQHGSCEVPAGCAGVVLRWLNPAQEAYLLFTLYTPGQARLFLDGQPVHSSVFSVPVGPHLLTLELEGSAAFMLAVQRHQAPHQEVLFSSQPDGSWLASDQALEEFNLPPEAHKSWDYKSAAKLGALPLGRPGPGPLTVQKAFELTP